MNLTFTSLVAALLCDPEVVAALRAAIGTSSGDELLTVSRAAALVGVRARVLRDAAYRGKLLIIGPRGARVVRRSELDRWLAATAPKAKAPIAEVDSDGAAFERSAFRLASGGRS